MPNAADSRRSRNETSHYLHNVCSRDISGHMKGERFMDDNMKFMGLPIGIGIIIGIVVGAVIGGSFAIGIGITIGMVVGAAIGTVLRAANKPEG